ncbi:glycosyl hydrolase family 95 catalytic domain-containing protein [Rhizosphaericola mali]|uniref:glycosyl hydrolase family 95 catalytic domain-containing protein n=1 Tax=Rhizosphaericola mali TaxID=2545455 RepID=UPI001CD9D482|nr:glycoside hydrolase N-terminal domain-containing protein [Rhizosphaericola mali]
MQNGLLWYDKPAKQWTDALPIGNGRLGAMIFGDPQLEHLQFNESTLWTGEPNNNARKGAYKYLPKIRELFANGKQKEAEDLAQKEFMGIRINEEHYDDQCIVWLKNVRKDTTQYLNNTTLYKNKIQLPMLNGWEKEGLDGVDGAIWFRVEFNLPKSLLGKDLKLYLGKIRDDDYAYINGHLVGETKGQLAKREYIVSSKILKEGINTVHIQVINWNDKGGFNGTKDGRKLFVLFPIENSRDIISLGNLWSYTIQNQDVPAFPKYEADYQPFGDIYFRFPSTNNVINYKRSLDIEQSLANVRFEENGIEYKRTYFASNPDQTIVAHFTADKKKSISFSTVVNSPHKSINIKADRGNLLQMTVKVKNGKLWGVANLYVKTKEGSIKVDGDSILVRDADEASVYLVAATNYIAYDDISGDPVKLCTKYWDKLNKKSYKTILSDHITDYQKLYKKFSIGFGSETFPNVSLSTDQRILQYSVSKDPNLIALYAQYGRYLLIASSRENSPLPANLQGIWNDQLNPSWGSKYTTNINLEMNYWPADPLNLSSCETPLFNMIQDLTKTGSVVAKEHYNLDGWVLHHNTDIWKATAPINASNHGIWVTGSAWLCQAIWDHFLFTRDTALLRKMYPAIKDATIFYIGFLVKDSKTDFLISTPSNSPEHGGLVAGPTMDHQMIRSLFKNYLAASKVLGIVDLDLDDRLVVQLPLIAPNKIGKYGQLQEWMDDVDDPKDQHRHISHIWGVFPGTDISYKDSSMMNAAKVSMNMRGDSGTGWSTAWKLNVWARMKDGNHALKMIDLLLSPADREGLPERGGIYRNMMDAHPPFQIDGNFGGPAGIAEMLVQSQNDYIELLPALPDSLSSGFVNGVKARGDVELNVAWKLHRLSKLVVKATDNGKYAFVYKGKMLTLNLLANKPYDVDILKFAN